MLPAPRTGWLCLLREQLCDFPKFISVQIDGGLLQALPKGGSVEVALPAETRHRVVLAAGEKVRRAFDAVMEPGEILEVTFAYQKARFGDKIGYRAQPWRSQSVTNSPVMGEIRCDVVEDMVADRLGFSEERSYSNGLDEPFTSERVFEKQWRRDFGILDTRSRTVGGGLGVTIGWLSVQGQIERTISQQYNINMQEEIKISERAMIPIGPRSSVTALWTVIERQRRGTVMVRAPQGSVPVPFWVVEGVKVTCHVNGGPVSLLR